MLLKNIPKAALQIRDNITNQMALMSVVMLLSLLSCGQFEEESHYKGEKNFGETPATSEDSSAENPEVTDDGGLGSLEDQLSADGNDSKENSSTSTPGDTDPVPPTTPPTPPTGNAGADDIVLKLAYTGLPRSKSVDFIDNPNGSAFKKWYAETFGAKAEVERAIYKLRLNVKTAITAGDGRFSEMHQHLKIENIPPVLANYGLKENLVNSKTVLQFAEPSTNPFVGCPAHFTCLTKVETRNEAGFGMTFCYVDSVKNSYTAIPNSIAATQMISDVYNKQFELGNNVWTSRFFEAVRFNNVGLDCSQIELTSAKERDFKIGKDKSLSTYQFKAYVKIEKHKLNTNFYDAIFNYSMVDPKVPAHEKGIFFETRTGLQGRSVYRLGDRSFYPEHLLKAFSFSIPSPGDGPFNAIKLDIDFKFTKKLDIASE